MNGTSFTLCLELLLLRPTMLKLTSPPFTRRQGHGGVTERKLGNHEPGSQLETSVTVLSNQVEAGTRTVVLSRPLKGNSQDYFTFSLALEDATIPILVAYGSSATFSYHKDKMPTQITLAPVAGSGSGACVCPQAPKAFGKASGSLLYHQTEQEADVGSGAVGFGANKCAEWPSTDLLNMSNPTCDIRAYRGGQWACHHMVSHRYSSLLALLYSALG